MEIRKLRDIEQQHHDHVTKSLDAIERQLYFGQEPEDRDNGEVTSIDGNSYTS